MILLFQSFDLQKRTSISSFFTHAYNPLINLLLIVKVSLLPMCILKISLSWLTNLIACILDAINCRYLWYLRRHAEWCINGVHINLSYCVVTHPTTNSYLHCLTLWKSQLLYRCGHNSQILQWDCRSDFYTYIITVWLEKAQTKHDVDWCVKKKSFWAKTWPLWYTRKSFIFWPFFFYKFNYFLFFLISFEVRNSSNTFKNRFL